LYARTVTLHSVRAEEPELLVGRGDRPDYGGGDAGFQAGLDLLAVVVAHIRHGIERAVQDVFGLQQAPLD
jgi:hypothetical protein